MSYKESAKSRGNVVQLDGGDRLPCRYCGTSTLRKTLEDLGARCQRCYDQYLAAPKDWPALPANVPDGPRAWVGRLKWRQQNGERLNGVQVGALAEVSRGFSSEDLPE